MNNDPKRLSREAFEKQKAETQEWEVKLRSLLETSDLTPEARRHIEAAIEDNLRLQGLQDIALKYAPPSDEQC